MRSMFDLINKVAKQLRDKVFAIAERTSLVRNDEMLAPLAKGGLRGDCIINNPTTAKRSPSLYKGGSVRNDEKTFPLLGEGKQFAQQTETNLPSYRPNVLTTLKKAAFTLTEVIIVMLVIAVIVAVSIKITRAKLNNITSYTYYAAYSTINSVTKEMLKDFDAENEDYISNNSIFYKFFPPAFAQDCLLEQDNKCYLAKYATGKDIDDYIQSKYSDQTTSIDADWVLREYVENVLNLTRYGAFEDIKALSQVVKYSDNYYDCFYYYNQSECIGGEDGTAGAIYNAGAGYKNRPDDFKKIKFWFVYTELSIEDPITPEPDPEPDPDPDPSCTPTTCTGGNTFDETSCSCVCNQTAPDTIPCGQKWNSAECQLENISPWPPTCPSGKVFNPDESVCGCVPVPQTIPRTGENYCKLFVSYSNTSQLAEDDECSGDAIADDEVDFSDKEPDMILRNGMYLYNVSQDPQKIDALNGNSKGHTYTKTEDDGSTTEIDIDEWGYTLYIDIDGKKGGNGVLWEDVYPFYVTLSGKVIPAYDTANAGLSGGDSKLHLQTSVADEYIDDATGHRLDWITKSAPFKTSACAMDYVKATTPYCSTAPAVTTNAQCTTTGHDCRLKTIMPVKFFGR